MKIVRNSFLVIVLLVVALWVLAPYLDQYDPNGEVVISGLSAPVRIVRDDKGVPYVYAETFEDVIAGQGFVTAQDRMFQLELMRLLAQGRLSELVGEAGVGMDTMVNLINVPAQAARQLEVLGAEDRALLESYRRGINGYLDQRADELTLPLRGNPPKPWTLEELIAVQVFNSWGSTVNWREELLSQSLIDHLGADQAAEISQITVNADDEVKARQASEYHYQRQDLQLSYNLDALMPAPDASGSNCWVTGSSRSTGGLPIVASDPHIDARRLPGFWHPIGLITPNWRAVGGAVASGPGIGIGRTDSIAWGITNGYGDMVDLYVETQDPENPNNYLEGANSIPFAKRTVVLNIKDSEAPDGVRTKTLHIRETSRGPIVSDHGMSVTSGKMLSLRWAVPEFFGEVLTTRRMLLAKSTAEAIEAIGDMATPLTYVVADYQGNIARTGAGFIPLRTEGDGAAPMPVLDGSDNWKGRIPPAEMPQITNPAPDWLASANHRIIPADYPYDYSTFFAHSWRYRRILEQMAKIDTWSTSDHWNLQLDNKNMLAEKLVPLMLPVLLADESTRKAGEILQVWDFMDDANQSAPLIYQSLLRHYARHVVEDDLGAELSGKYLNDYYYWHERITQITLQQNSQWLDDNRTEVTETREDLFARAAQDMLAELVPVHGAEMDRWQWGDAHTITFSHPLVPGDLAAEWLGGGTHPMNGSGETLNRGAYQYSAPYRTTFFASMRLVMDLSDPDKIEAHIPGGVSERLFNTQMTNDLENWLSGTPNYWWFSDKAIADNAVSEMILNP